MSDPAEAHARRGAAFTFNAAAFVACVRKIVSAAPEEVVWVPSFDHGAGDPVEEDIAVLPQHKFVLVEGLYVLRRAPPPPAVVRQNRGAPASRPFCAVAFSCRLPLPRLALGCSAVVHR